MNAISHDNRLLPVYLRELKLTGFRNYQTLKLDLDQRHVVLTGKTVPEKQI